MNYYIDIDQVEEKIIFFEKELRLIDEKVTYIKNLISSINWESESSNIFKNKYNQYVYELEDLKMGLLYYIKILAQFGSKYGNFYDEMEKQFKTSIEEMESEMYG